MANKVEGVAFSAGFAGFEGGSITPMKFDKTLHFIFAAELKPSAPARFIHFVSFISSDYGNKSRRIHNCRAVT
jgi:hypothetical protein